MFDWHVIEGFTFYQFLGFATIFFAVLNIALYLYAVVILWNSTHSITKSLRDKIAIEALLTLTTVMMGIGAFLETSPEWWQFSYACRVILLIISPFVIYRLVKACYVAANPREVLDKNGKDSS